MNMRISEIVACFDVSFKNKKTCNRDELFFHAISFFM